MSFWGFPKKGAQKIYALRTMADEKVCDECSELEGQEFVCEEDENPTSYFEHAEVWDEEIDAWKANVHPNCRCWLELIDVNVEEE